jgi:hypothetical protein
MSRLAPKLLLLNRDFKLVNRERLRFASFFVSLNVYMLQVIVVLLWLVVVNGDACSLISRGGGLLSLSRVPQSWSPPNICVSHWAKGFVKPRGDPSIHSLLSLSSSHDWTTK